jgi:hypothetical protein
VEDQIGLIHMRKCVKELKDHLFQTRKDAFYIAMNTHFRAFKLQIKYKRLRLRSGPDMDARALKAARNSLNFVTFTMHGLVRDQAAPKVAEFLKDRLAKE